MQNTAPRALGTRLHLWKTFFESRGLIDGTPGGLTATNIEYDYDHLIELARDTDSRDLHDLADVVELMAHNYITGMNNRLAEMLMVDDSPAPPVGGEQRARHIRVTVADIDAALRG